MSAALVGCWCVIHVASPTPTLRDAALFQRVNVGGTGVLLAACKAVGVKRFVHTSSASVVFDGRDQRNFDESAPKPLAAMDAYTKSKWDAEVLVLAANGPDLMTTAIRPHGIFGSRDPHFLPVLAQTGAKGKSRYQIGSGDNLVDFTYVENVAYAHALAAVQLKEGGQVNGQAYFITNREPIFFWEFITRMQRAWGYPLPSLPLPVALMRPLAVLSEAVGQVAKFRPTFTTQAINYAGSAHYYSSAKAVREMGYQPPIDMDEAIKRSLNYYWDLRNKSPAAVATRAKGEVKTQSPMTGGFASSCALKSGLIILGIVLALGFCGCTTSLLVFVAALTVYGITQWMDSFGATPVMFTAPTLTAEEKRKVILITGANRGLGFHTAIDFLERGYATEGGQLLLTCRDATKGEEAVAALKAKFPRASVRSFVLDLTRFDNVRSLVSDLVKSDLKLDVLVNNAGAMVEVGVTVDGHDAQFQGNYLAHFLLVQELLKSEVLAPAARIVNVSSLMHRFIGLTWGTQWSDSQDLVDRSTYARLTMYCRTKLLQIMWTHAQQRVFNIEANAARQASATSPLANRRTIVSVNPGAVATDFIHHFIPASLAKAIESALLLLIEKTPKQGVQAIVYAAVAQEMDNVGGVYVDNCRVCLPSKVARNRELQDYAFDQATKWCAK